MAIHRVRPRMGDQPIGSLSFVNRAGHSRSGGEPSPCLNDQDQDQRGRDQNRMEVAALALKHSLLGGGATSREGHRTLELGRSTALLFKTVPT
jgi:hypothetical protein